MTSTDLSTLLRDAIVAELPHLKAVNEERASLARGEGKWSPKQELGHLIDSASNNHVRIGAAAVGEYRGPGYRQEDWVRLHGYGGMPWEEIVAFWFQYNRLLVRLIERIPPARLGAPCTVGDSPAVTLAFLIEDYVVHLRHHIDQLLQRERVTPYPR